VKKNNPREALPLLFFAVLRGQDIEEEKRIKSFLHFVKLNAERRAL